MDSAVGQNSKTAVAARDAAASNRLVFAALLFAFAIGAVFAALNKNVTRGFDEVAHASYIAHLQSKDEVWPRLEEMRLLDAGDFHFTNEGNYLNHPPLFYLALARLGPRLEHHPDAMRWHRIANVAIGVAGLAAALALGFAAGLTRQEFLAFAVPIFSIPVLIPLAGAINNDNLAFAAGAVVVTAAFGLLRSGRTVWLASMLAATVIASAAKLTGLLLAGGFSAAVFAYLIWRKRFPASWMPAVALAFTLALAPYIVFVLQYGSPAPNTAAQMAMLRSGTETTGWANETRLSFPAYVAWFTASFFSAWMPTLAPRNTFQYTLLVLPLTAVLCALAGLWISLRRFARRKEGPLDAIVVAGFAALAATFAVHVWFSYGRHLETGWMMDAFPRYYLPLAVILPLAAIVLIREIGHPRLQLLLAAFIIAAPLFFRIFGGPISL